MAQKSVAAYAIARDRSHVPSFFFYPKLNCAISISRSLFPLDRKKKKEKGGGKIDTGGDEQKGKCEGKKRAGILLVEEDIRSFIVRFDGNDQSNSFHSG